ncbi:hypothetical protein [Lacticaseibacillus camelliae]|uniref:hypothetical protein n=1 Tax=Lacticaseibacillus camelliae TaxID=381742 RepID=UPI003B848751
MSQRGFGHWCLRLAALSQSRVSRGARHRHDLRAAVRQRDWATGQQVQNLWAACHRVGERHSPRPLPHAVTPTAP